MKKWLIFVLFVLNLIPMCFSQNTSCIGQGLTTYCAIPALTSPGGATGFFRWEKATDSTGKKHWLYVAPDGHYFLQRALYDFNSDNLDSNVIPVKYGGNKAAFCTHELNRILTYGYNSEDIYYSTYCLPVKTNAGSGSVIKVPFVFYVSTAADATSSPSTFGWTDTGMKDMCSNTQTNHGFTHFCGKPTLDTLDPRWQAANNLEVALQFTNSDATYFNPTSPIKNSPWVIAYSLNDAGFFDIFTGGGNVLNGSPNYPNPAQIIATGRFYCSSVQCGATGLTWQNPQMYAKRAWACGGNNPTTCDGTSYLEQKYGTLPALKAAWGSCANGYTAFGTTGNATGSGFGTGTGVLDEDGQGACFGSSNGDYYLQTNLPATVVADLNAFLQIQTYSIYYDQIYSLRIVYGDTNHNYVAGTFGGVGDAGIRDSVALGMAQAASALGANLAIVMNWNSTFPAQALATNSHIYNITGLPQYVGEFISANLDSPFKGCNGYFQADFSTQNLKGQHYATDISNADAQQGANGDYYSLGSVQWALSDKGGGEKISSGVVTTKDNVYNGCEATVAGCGNDAWGYPTGGEVAGTDVCGQAVTGNYGNFSTNANTGNRLQITTLINYFTLPPSKPFINTVVITQNQSKDINAGTK